MYPYNRNTQLYGVKKQARGTGAQLRTRNNQNVPLSSDRRLQELLTLARQESAKTEKKYEALGNHTKLTEAQDIIHTMRIDEKKHHRILREVLFTIFSDTLEEVWEDIIDMETEKMDTEDLLEDLLLTEMDDISFYRELLFAMDTTELRELFYEIITNKQNHTAALNHLYAKYFAKTSGNEG